MAMFKIEKVGRSSQPCIVMYANAEPQVYFENWYEVREFIADLVVTAVKAFDDDEALPGIQVDTERHC